MNRRPMPWWFYRVLDFGAGFILVLLVYAGRPEGSSRLASFGELLLMAAIFGTVAAVFGRSFWRFVRRWVR